MKLFKSLALILLGCCCVSIMLAQKQQPRILAETAKARVEVDNGQTRLALIIDGESDKEVNSQNQTCINLRLNDDVWSSLLSLVCASWGEAPIQMKDERGHKVVIQKGKINGEDGLLFLSGSAYVAILNRDIRYLHGASHNLHK